MDFLDIILKNPPKAKIETVEPLNPQPTQMPAPAKPKEEGLNIVPAEWKQTNNPVINPQRMRSPLIDKLMGMNK